MSQPSFAIGQNEKQPTKDQSKLPVQTPIYQVCLIGAKSAAGTKDCPI